MNSEPSAASVAHHRENPRMEHKLHRDNEFMLRQSNHLAFLRSLPRLCSGASWLSSKHSDFNTARYHTSHLANRDAQQYATDKDNATVYATFGKTNEYYQAITWDTRRLRRREANFLW